MLLFAQPKRLFLELHGSQQLAGAQLLWPIQVGSWSEVAQTTIKWSRNGRRFVHTTAQAYRPPFSPFRHHPDAVRSLLKPVETAGGC